MGWGGGVEGGAHHCRPSPPECQIPEQEAGYTSQAEISSDWLPAFQAQELHPLASSAAVHTISWGNHRETLPLSA